MKLAMNKRTEMYATAPGGNESSDVVTNARDGGFQGFEEITCKQGICF